MILYRRAVVVFSWFGLVCLVTLLQENVALAASPPPINIINLDHDTTRWNQVTGELASKGKVPRKRIRRLPAVYGKTLSKEELRQNSTKLARTFCTPGMIGCFLSHKQFWIQTLEGRDPCQIVLEDDVLVAGNFCQLVDEAIAELDTNPETCNKWDVLILGAFGSVHPNGKHGLRDTNAIVVGGQRRPKQLFRTSQNQILIHVPRRPFGTHAYVLSKRGATKLLSLAWFASGHVDCVIWGIRDLNMYCCDHEGKMLAYQNTTAPSTIGIVPWGPETWFPSHWEVDPYSKVTVKWALGEPLVRIPYANIVITIGRAILATAAAGALAIGLRDRIPWLLPFQLSLTLAVAILIRIISRPVKRPSDQPML